MKNEVVSKYEEQIVNGIAFICGLFILIPFKLKPILVFLLLLFFFIFPIRNSNIKRAAIISLLFFSYLFSLLYCQNYKFGIEYLIRFLPVFLIPLCYSLLPNVLQIKFNGVFFKTFIFSSAVYVFLIFIYLFTIGFFNGSKDFNVSLSYITFLFWGINEHPIYISTVFGISLILIKYISFSNKQIKFFLIITLLIGMLFLARKGVIISFFLASLFFLHKSSKKEIALLLGVALFLFLGSLLIPEIRFRYIELFDVNSFLNNENSSSGIRYILWENAFLLLKNAFFLGYSIGDVQDVIVHQLYKGGYFKLAESNTNIHNQYLQIVLTSGFIGFFVFFVSMTYSIIKLVKYKSYLGLTIVVFFLFNFTIESYLYRQNGILLFSLFLSTSILCLSNNINSKKNLLIIGPFPGPIKGVSLSNLIILKSLTARNWRVKHINTELSNFLDVEFGSFSFFKLKFLKFYLEICKVFTVQKVYITIGITFFGVLKYAPYIILSKILNKELIVHVHSDYLKTEYKSLKGIKKWLFYKLMSSFDKGIVLSESLRDNLSLFIDKENIYDVYNFYEDDLIHDLEELQNSKDYSEVRLFFLSNLIMEKGINNLLKAIQLLNNEGIYPKLKIAGAKVESNNIDELISQLHNTEYLGVVFGDKKRELLIWGNVFCLPTFYSMEGQPISIIEAMALDNLILTTKHAGIIDLCKDENTVFCKKNDVTDLYDKLKYIHNNWESIKVKGINNGINARKNFSESNFVDNIEEVIKRRKI